MRLRRHREPRVHAGRVAPRRGWRALPISIAAAILLASCGGGGAARTIGPAEAVERLASAVVIDVRTPEEFAVRHVVGARNLDVQDPSFDARIAELDRGATYVLYCRTGNRSAVAAGRMLAAGFTDVLDAGALEELAAAGAPIEP